MRRQRGQIVTLLAFMIPMLLALCALSIAEGMLLARNNALATSAESAALSAASQINVPQYYSNGTIVLPPITQPDTTPCQTGTTGYSSVLCAIQTVLCNNYDSASGGASSCINSPSSYCPATSSTNSTVPVPVCNIYDSATSSCPNGTAGYPNVGVLHSGYGAINYCASESNASQVIQVNVWYVYANPFGTLGILPNTLTTNASGTAALDVTQCTNGTNTC